MVVNIYIQISNVLNRHQGVPDIQDRVIKLMSILLGMTAIVKEAQEEIFSQVKKGEKVAGLSIQYGANEQRTNNWLKGSITKQISILQYNKVMKENRELKAIVGA